MTAHRIVSIETARTRSARHDVIVAVHTGGHDALVDHRWTVRGVLAAMNKADRFYTMAPNGRQAHVQKYRCATCHSDHIRTHLSDGNIHEIHNLPKGHPASVAAPA